MDQPGLRLRGIEKIVSRYISIGVYSSEVAPQPNRVVMTTSS